jgi:hypothetical protein
LTETVSTEPVVIPATETPSMNEKIIERRTIVHKALVDQGLMRIACEKLKNGLFTKFAFYWFQPKPEEIQFVSLEQYYEPYIAISGRYFVDYLRDCTYIVQVAEGVKEVILRTNKYLPETSKSTRIVKLHGEERLIKEEKAFLLLDKNGRESDVEVPVAAAEENPAKVMKEFGITELPENADVNFIKDRIVKRPEDVGRIVEEIFEVTERTVVYCPRYKLLFRWAKTGEERILVIDGVTAQRIKKP